jgi:isopenicillin-N epimerase
MWTCGDQAVRNLWSLNPDVAFLNHGSYGAVPLKIRQNYFDWHERIEQNPVAFLSRQLPELLSAVRRDVSGWLNAQPDGLAFVSNATSGVGSVLASMMFSQGDEIVFHNHGYGWVRQGLANLAAASGVVVREANIPLSPQSDSEIIDAFAKVLNSKTKLLICDHVTSPTALVFPVKSIVELAQSASVPVLVDGAHAPAFMSLDTDSIGADFYTGNFHKWLCAPRGAAFLSVASHWRGIIRPQSVSYSGGVSHHAYDQSMTGFFDWTGTNNFAAWLTVPQAIRFHEDLGWERVFSQRSELLKSFYEFYISEMNLTGFQLPARHLLGAMVTLPWPTLPEIELTNALARTVTQELHDSAGVEIPVICFANQLHVRLSAQIYNRAADVEKLVGALAAHRFSAVRVR